ncbi:hypothetical protein N480_05535 [Pseudoalteromonas luteoviolacea S2607]|uniref:redoxin domain-containing protein n=1 Tax=Pseudoalteromonas luteoviolacea TaxID=43657 RepID=UPI0007B09CBE|nr:redoxin domain-containing protein [Pseudoalteromonas luteoviolacea]KZN30414.1 hypothetical protein N480_05535 [Pseudoalteromonas luteoviolacea S2607]
MPNNYTNKLHPGMKFPEFSLPLLNGEVRTVGKPQNGLDWQLVLIYRGQHCPLCTKYLNQLQVLKSEFNDIGVDIIAVSGDSKAQLETHLEKLTIDYTIAYGLTIEQMKVYGLYISDPRSAEETDHPFSEPGLFVINEDGLVQVVDISNNPFVRPELGALKNGLAWIRNPDNHYPIRGMHTY